MVCFDMYWTRISHLPHASPCLSYALKRQQLLQLLGQAFRGPVVFSCWMKCSKRIFMSHTLLGAGDIWGWPCNRVGYLSLPISATETHAIEPSSSGHMFETWWTFTLGHQGLVFSRVYTDGWGMMGLLMGTSSFSTTQWLKCFPWPVYSVVVKLIGTPVLQMSNVDLFPTNQRETRSIGSRQSFWKCCIQHPVDKCGDTLEGLDLWHSRGHIQSRCGCVSEQPGHPLGDGNQSESLGLAA